MALINRFKGIIQGAMVLTGNTLQIRQGTTFPPAANDFTNGSYISTNTSLVAAAGFPSGTTFLASDSSSTAVLNIMSGSTVVFAQLFWTMRSSTSNASINFITPNGSNLIAPNTALNQLDATLSWRVQDVTSIVNAAGSGTYEIGNVPGPNIANGTSVQTNAWYMIVIYKNSNLPFRFFSVNTGLSAVSTGSPSDLSINIITPSSGAVNGYLLVTESNGDLADGARISVGATSGTAVQVGNPSTTTWDNNPPFAQINNMLPGNILIADCEDPNIGLLDTRGNFGTFNKNPFANTAPAFARNITDILGIDISDTLSNNQTSLFTRVFYSGSGSGTLSSQSIQVDINAAILNPRKTVDKEITDVGETLKYTVVFTNSGLLDANDVVFMDTIPNGTSFIDGSVDINGANDPTANPSLPGIDLGTIAINDTTTISFRVLVGNTVPSPNPIPNSSQLTYNFVPATGQPTEFVDSTSNTVFTQLNTVSISSSKVVNKIFANLGDIVTYTIPLVITGSVSANNVIFIDTLPNDIELVSNSLTVNGTTVPGSTNPPGLDLGTLPANTTITISFKVLVNTIPSPNPILNAASTSFNYILDPTVPIVKDSSSNTNIVATFVNHASLEGIVKSVNKNFATCNDILTYTITVPNSGNATAFNVIIKDTIPNGTEFIPGTVTIDGNPTNFNPLSINVGTIPGASQSVLTFQVKVKCD